MKLVILDGNAVNPGDAPWDEFKKLADLTVYPRTAPCDVVSRIKDSDGVLLNKILITRDILDKCPKLRYIGVLATGYNVIDLDACRERGVCVTNIPSYSTKAVAQHTFALILNFTNSVAFHNASVQNGDWIKSPDFCYWKSPLTELAGKTLGVLGYGNIGKTVAMLARSFDMNVLVAPHKKNSVVTISGRNSENGIPIGPIKESSLSEMLSNSDFVTLHAPLTNETNHIINSSTINQMKTGAYLINTSRGPLVDESAVKEALTNKKLAGYACDVLSSEPMDKDCPLLGAPNCVITPHVAWAPLQTRKRLQSIALNNLLWYLKGQPVNVVSG